MKNLGIRPNYDESHLGLLQAGVEAAEVEYEWFAGVAKNIKLISRLKMKGIYAAFPMPITLIFNHLK